MNKYFKNINRLLIMVIFLTIINSIIINIISINHSFALTPAEQQLLNQQLIIQQQQEQRRQQEQNQLQIDDAENIRKTRVGSDGIESIDGSGGGYGQGPDGSVGGSNGTGSSNSSSTSNCIKFNKIELIGNTIYSTRYLNRKVLNKYIDKCINKKNIDDITNSLMKIYIDSGYSTTRIYFDISKLRTDNIFIFVIDEGKVNDIILNNIYPEKEIENEARSGKMIGSPNHFSLSSHEVPPEQSEDEKLKIKNEKALNKNNKEKDKSKNETNENREKEEIKEKEKTEEKNKKKKLNQEYVIENKENNKTIEKYNTSNKEQNKSKEDKTSFLDKYKSFRLKSQTFFAFPFLKGKEFNLRDFEQGLDQLNRLQSNNATLDIKPVEVVKDNHSPLVGESNEQEPARSSFGGGLDKQSKKEQSENKLNKNKTNKKKLNKSTSPTSSYSNIIINNQKSRSTYLNFGIDNSGNKSTGERLASISISQDNLLAIDDNIYLKYTQDIDSENNKRYNKSFYGNISIPLGYWTFNPSISYSKYLTTINGYYTSFHTSGNTLTQMYNIDRVMYRNQLYKLNLGSNLTIRDTESYIRDLKSITGSRKSSNINLYLNNIIYTRLGTIIIKPSYQRGLDWFNSKKDEGHNLMLKTEPKLQYDMVKLYVYYNTRINLPLFTKTQIIDPNTNQPIMQEVEKEVKIKTIKKDKDNNIIKDKKGKPIEETKNEKVKEQIPYKVRTKINLNYTLTFDSQYSWDTLYGTDQFSIGGEYTVRGFREATISGDNGYYIRNDLSINLQQLFPRFIINSKVMNYGSNIKGKNLRLSINDFLSRAYLSIFYDYGYVQDKYGDDSDTIYNSQSGHMSGTGIALNYYGRYLNWSLTYAKALHAPNYLQSRDGIKKEGHSLYWRIGGRF